MVAMRLSDKLAYLARATRADMLNAPAERVIAQCRLLLCALSSLAIALEPTQPAQYAEATAQTLLAYLAFGAILVALTRYRFLSPRTCQAIHFADVVIISVLLCLTDGPTSPFFVFFTFALLAATLRWRWQAVVATAAVLAGVFLVASINKGTSASAEGNDLNTAIISGAYLIVAGGMLAYVSTFYERSRQRFAKLAHWPALSTGGASSPSIPQLLAHSAIALEAPRILAIWEETEEPYVNLAAWREGTYEETRHAAGTFGDLVNSALTGVAFLTGEASSEFVLLQTGPIRIKKEPIIDPHLTMEFSIRGVATAPFVGVICSGRVFILDCDSWTDDHLLLTEIIAARTGIELDRQAVQRRNEEAIASQERMRLTRDLHDGVLQNLTAAALQLNLTEQASDQERGSRLDLVKQLLAKEQRRIREFVDETFPKRRADKLTILGRDLQHQLEETGRYWNCTASLSVAPPDVQIPQALAGQLSLMLSEAVANAVRHGGASNVEVEMAKAEGQLVINVRDNGKGFNGQRTEEAPQEPVVADIGVTSLRERVCALGGSLTVSSYPTGAELAIRFPVP
jgi:signal transduction histidine kinase